MHSPNNEKNYRLMCAVLVERGTIRRECGKLLEGKSLDEEERKALCRALAEVAEELALLSNPRPIYHPYSISEPAEFPPPHSNPTTSAGGRETKTSSEVDLDEGNSIDTEPVPRGTQHPNSKSRVTQQRRSRSGAPVRDRVLSCVGESKSIRQVDIATAIGVEVTAVYNIVNAMVIDAHLTKTTKNFGPNSRPTTFIELTEKGESELEKLVRVQASNSN
jgi:hypothetical protein